MPIRRINEEDIVLVMPYPCKNTDHNPPRSTEHLEPGMYEHSCPACGKLEFFNVPTGLRRG